MSNTRNGKLFVADRRTRWRKHLGNPADARLVRRSLEEYAVEGERVVIADGEKAIAFIQAIDAGAALCPDLAIADLNLPKKPGREVLNPMRMSRRRPSRNRKGLWGSHRSTPGDTFRADLTE